MVRCNGTRDGSPKLWVFQRNVAPDATYMSDGDPPGDRLGSYACLVTKSVDTELEEDHTQDFWRKAIDWGRLVYPEAGQGIRTRQIQATRVQSGAMYSPHGIALVSNWVHHVICCVAKDEYYAKHISQSSGGLSLEHSRVVKQKKTLEEDMSGGDQKALVETNEETDTRTERVLYLECKKWFSVI